jgi:hypothetical protein
MLELFLAFFVLALIMIGMAVGIIMGKKSFKGLLWRRRGGIKGG